MRVRLSSKMPWVGALLCALAVTSLGSLPAAAGENPLWGRQCANDDRKDACVVRQFVTAQPGDRQLLLAQLGYHGPNGSPRLILAAPLGVLLTKGVSFGIDGKKPLTVPFETCNPGGCLSIIDMDKAAFGQFRKGNVLTVRYYLAGEEKPLDLPVKLEGLNAALKSIAP